MAHGADLSALPANSLSSIIGFCGLLDGQRVLVSCKKLLLMRQDVFDHQTCLSVRNANEVVFIEHAIQFFRNLVHLDLGKWTTQDTLNVLATTKPRIHSLSLTGSNNNLDILCLKHFKALEILDVTFCDKVTYEATLELREFLPDLLVKRVPFQGHFVAKNVTLLDPYTAWPDGTIYCENLFNSHGFVDICRPWDANDPKRIYSTFEFPRSYPGAPPPFDLFHYQASSAILVGPNNIIVAALCGGCVFPPRLPTNSKSMERVPFGKELIFDRRGNNVSVYSDARSMRVINETIARLDDPRPPRDILRRNLKHCREKKAHVKGTRMEQSPQEAFHDLHVSLNGSSYDVLDIYERD